MNWTMEEEIILVELYFRIREMNIVEKKIYINAVSNILKNRAQLLDLKTETYFRNLTGIEMKLLNIEFIETNGQKGLSSVSYIDKRAFNLFVEESREFRRLFNEISDKYEIKEIYSRCNHEYNIILQTEKIILLNKYLYMKDSDKIEQLMKINESITVNTRLYSHMKEDLVKPVLVGEKMYFESSLNEAERYKQFTLLTEMTPELQMHDNRSDKNKANDEQLTQNIKTKNQEQFLSWLKITIEGVDERIKIKKIDKIVEILKIIDEFILKIKISSVSLFLVESAEYINICLSTLKTNTVFSKRNEEKQNDYVYALEDYAEFLKRQAIVKTEKDIDRIKTVRKEMTAKNICVECELDSYRSFYNWLIKNGTAKTTADKTISLLTDIEKYALDHKLINTSIFHINSLKIYNEFINELKLQTDYAVLDKKFGNKINVAMFAYAGFLRAHSDKNIEGIQNAEYFQIENTADKKPSKINCSIKDNNEALFREWLKKKKIENASADIFIESINSVNKFILENRMINISILNINTYKILKDLLNELKSKMDYIRFNNISNNIYNIAMSAYAGFLRSDMNINKEVKEKKKHIQIENTQKNKTENNEYSQQNGYNYEFVFREWLKRNKTTNSTADIMIESVIFANNYAMNKGIISSSIFTINSPTAVDNCLNILRLDPEFQKDNRMKNNSYIYALQTYSVFLRRNAFFEKIDNSQKITKDVQNKKKICDSNIQINENDSLNVSEYSDKQSSSIEELKPYRQSVGLKGSFKTKGSIQQERLFSNWLISSINLSQSTARNYTQAINKIMGCAVDAGLVSSHIFDITEHTILSDLINLLKINENFVIINEHHHQVFLAALNRYLQFLNGKICLESSRVSPCVNRPKVKYDVEYYIERKKCPKEYNAIYCLLNDYFPNGLKVKNNIQLQKFRNKARALGEISDQELVSNICKIAINCGDDLYITPDCAAGKSDIIERVLTYVHSIFENGKHTVYYDKIFSAFEDELIYTNIYNSRVLKAVIDFYFADTFVAKQNYLSDTGSTANKIDDDIVKYISDFDYPISIEDIIRTFENISKQKIRQIVTNNINIIRVSKGTYRHKDSFAITEEEKKLIYMLVSKEIKAGFISSRRTYSFLNIKMPDFCEKYGIENHLCLFDLIEAYWGNVFSCMNNFIGPIGEKMSLSIMVGAFLNDKKRFTLQEYSEYLFDNAIENRSNILREAIDGKFLRINSEIFVSLKEISIDLYFVEQVDLVIYKYLVDDIIPVESIKNFILFPTFEYSWNEFLLDSFIRTFSLKFTTFMLSDTNSQANSVIITKNSFYQTTEEIFVKVLSSADKAIPFSNVDEALDYLFQNGYIARRRMKNIDQLYRKAKSLNVKMGS